MLTNPKTSGKRHCFPFDPVHATLIGPDSHFSSTLSSNLPSALPPPRPLPPLTIKTLTPQIRLVHNFFLAKLHAPAPSNAANSNATLAPGAENDIALIEDDDLPQKQRFPKPRLPPTGKISSPRKRPIREPGPGKGHPRKKIKMMEEKEREKERVERMEKPLGGGKADDGADAPMERGDSPSMKADAGDAAGDANGAGGAGGMISPESLEAQ